MTLLALFLAVALILSYLESLIPLPIPVPGVKLGLANIISLVVLETFGLIPALILVIMRVLIIGFLFGSMSSILYALTGGILSVLVMGIMVHFQKNKETFSTLFISIIGAITHNCGQLIVAALTIQNIRLMTTYLPFLVLLAIPTGLVVGILSRLMLRTDLRKH